MARVSLILPVAGDAAPTDLPADDFREALEAAGREVEVVVAADSAAVPLPSGPWRSARTAEPGRASAAVEGLRHASGEWLVVVDARRGYGPDDVLRVVEALERGDAELVISSSAGGDSRVVGSLTRRAFGTTDPFSGLVGMTRRAFQEADAGLQPVGGAFAMELLARVPGRRADVPSGPVRGVNRRRPRMDDVRHLKRLADHRFGNASRLIQFCLVGASGMVVDLTCYALFQFLFRRTWLADKHLGIGGRVLDVDLAVAAALAIAAALAWNFSLNRRLTFSYARGGSAARQFVTYVLSNLLGISVSFGLRLGLPMVSGYFDRHKLAAAVVGIVAATGFSFSLSRWVVFRKGPDAPPPTPRPAAPRDAALVESPA